MEELGYLQALLAGEELPDVTAQYRDIWVLVYNLSEGLLVVDQARILADALGAHVHVVLIQDAAAGDLISAGADHVHVANENLFGDIDRTVDALATLLGDTRPEFVLSADDWLGREVAPPLAQRLGAGLATRCLEIGIDTDRRTLSVVRPVYGGDYFEAVDFAPQWPQFATLSTASLHQPYLDPTRTGQTEPFLPMPSPGERVRKLGEVNVSIAPMTLRDADVVCTGGIALRQEGFARLKELADHLGGVMAGSREAYEMGWIEAAQMVDLTGHRVAPSLYMAFGVTGDELHDAAIKGAKFVVAVHPNPGAPIFSHADLGIVGDPLQVIDQLLAS